MRKAYTIIILFVALIGYASNSYATEPMACLLGVNCEEVSIQIDQGSDCAEINRLVCQIKKISKKVEQRKVSRLKKLKNNL